MTGQDSLQLFDVGVLLQALSSNLKVGVLAVRSGRRRKYLHLDRATLRGVVAQRPRVTLQKVLYNHRSVQVAHLKAAAEALGANRTDAEIADFLVEHGYVTDVALARARKYQLIEEVLELFYWPDIGFEFHAGEEPAVLERLREKGCQHIGANVPIDSILINCTKITDDIRKFDSVTPSLRDVYDLTITSLADLERAVPDAAEREFMLLIDGVRDMREVLKDMRMNRFEVLELFYNFHQRELLRPKNGFELLMLAENRRKDFAPEKRVRVLERVLELGVEGFDVLLPLAETYETLGRAKDAAKIYVQHARNALASEDAETALASARRATQLVPDDPTLRRFEVEVLTEMGRDDEIARALKVLGEVLRGHGDLGASRKALRRAAQLAPSMPGLWRRLGEVYADEGSTLRAAACNRRAGDLLREANDVDGAINCYRAAMEHREKAWSVRFRLVEALHEAGRTDVAVQELSGLVAIFDNDNVVADPVARIAKLRDVEAVLTRVGGAASSAGQFLGTALLRAGAREDAERVFRQSVTALDAARRHQTALDSYAWLVELCPDDIGVRRAMARCNAAMGDHNRALSQLRRVASRLTASEDWGDAASVFEEMLAIDPSSLDAHRGLALALHHGGRETEAAEHFHRAALLHRAQGNSIEAVPFLREAVALRPTDADLLAEYCELLTHRGGETRELLSALAALVELRMRSGMPARAAVALTSILAIDSAFPSARAILCDAAHALTRMADAPSPAPTGASVPVAAPARASDG